MTYLYISSFAVTDYCSSYNPSKQLGVFRCFSDVFSDILNFRYLIQNHTFISKGIITWRKRRKKS